MAHSVLTGPRFGWERIRRGKLLAFVLLLGLVLTDGVASSVLLLESVTTREGLEATTRGLGQERFVRLSSAAETRADYDLWQSNVGSALAHEMPGVFDVSARSATLANLVPRAHDGVGYPDDLLRARPFLLGYDQLAAQLTMVAGDLPRPSGLEFVVTEANAARYELKPGTQLCVSYLSHPDSTCLRTSGVVRPRKADDPFWSGRPILAGTLLSSVETVYAARDRISNSSVQAGTLLTPRPDALAALGGAELIRRLNRFRGRLLDLAPDLALQTNLDDGIASFLTRQAAATYATRMVGVQLLGLILLYLVFAADHGWRQRQRSLAMLRARGWTRLRVWRLLAIEAGILVLAALPLGLASAMIAVRAATRLSFGTDAGAVGWREGAAAWPALALAAAAGLAILAWRAWIAAGIDVLPARRRLDVAPAWSGWRPAAALGLLAIPVALTARSLASLGSDVGGAALLVPLGAVLMAAPLMSRLALAPARWLSTRSRDLARAMAAWELRRVSGGHRRLALLMVGGFAVTVFAGVYMTSEPRTMSDRAAYLAGSDLRVSMNNPRPPLAETVTALPGFESATLSFRAIGRVGNFPSRFQLLGVDPVTFKDAAWWRPDLDRSSLDSILASLSLGETDGVRAPGQPGYFGLWAMNTGPPLHITARLADANDRAAIVDLGEVALGAWRHLEGEIHFDRPPGYPLRFRELQLSAAAPYRGMLGLSDLGFRQTGAADPVVVEAFNEPHGWWSTSPATSARAGAIQINPGPVRGAARAGQLALNLDPGQNAFVKPPAPTVPALLAQATLDRLGLRTGAMLRVTVDTSPVMVRLVGSVASFPTLFSDTQDFLVAALDPLLNALGQGGYWQPWPNEAWVRVGAAAAPGDARYLRELDPVTAVVDRRAIDSAAQDDPIWRSIRAELLIGSCAGAALAVVAFGLHFTAAARGRYPEFAVLRADGLSLRRLRVSLGWEQAPVLGGSLLAGALLGMALTWLIVPSIEISTDLLARPVPAPRLVVDPGLAAISIGVLLGAAALTSVLAVKVGTRLDVVSELRVL
jgi:hypothetical protein